MATGWSDYQVTKGYMEWFYYVKFAVVSAIVLGFAWFSISRVIGALKGEAPPTKAAAGGPARVEDGAAKPESTD